MAKQTGSATRELGSADARQKPRYKIPFAAQIDTGNERPFAGQVANISSSGVLIRCPGMILDIDTGVDIVLQYERSGQPLELRLPATAVRVEQDAIAFRFERCDSDTYTELIDLIYDTERCPG